MKRKIELITVILLCVFLFAGCKGGEKPEDTEINQDTQDIEQDAQNISQDTQDIADEDALSCFVTFEDGDCIEYPVEAYGEEFALPESSNKTATGTFYGWIGNNGLYQPGDKVVAEEFMGFVALRSDPNMGTLFALDEVRGGYYTCSSEEEEMELYSPYDNYEDGDYEDFFDCWIDESGNKYEGKDFVSVKKGEVLILKAVYSTDLSAAYKVNVYYNTGIDDFDDEYQRYVKKGASIPLWLMLEPAGYSFDGWYDQPDGGNLMGNDTDMFTPDSDISLYGHWTKE